MDLVKLVKLFPDLLNDVQSLYRSTHFTFDLVRFYPNKNWNWKEFSGDQAVPINLVREHKDKDRNFSLLSKRKDMAWDIIFSSDLYVCDWNFNILSRREDLTWDIIFSNDILCDWDFGILSRRADFSWDKVKEYPNKNWDWTFLCNRSDFPFDMFKDNFSNYDWDLDILSQRDDFPLDIVYSNLHLPWNFFHLCDRINFYIVEECIRISAHLRYKLTSNNTLPFYIIDKLCDLELNWPGISLNITITEEFVIKYIDKLSINLLSGNSAITLQFIDSHQELKWDFDELSSNPNLTSEYIAANKNKPWNFEYICRFDYGDKHIHLRNLKDRRKHKETRDIQLYQTLPITKVLIKIVIDYLY